MTKAVMKFMMMPPSMMMSRCQAGWVRNSQGSPFTSEFLMMMFFIRFGRFFQKLFWLPSSLNEDSSTMPEMLT